MGRYCYIDVNITAYNVIVAVSIWKISQYEIAREILLGNPDFRNLRELFPSVFFGSGTNPISLMLPPPYRGQTP